MRQNYPFIVIILIMIAAVFLIVMISIIITKKVKQSFIYSGEDPFF